MTDTIDTDGLPGLVGTRLPPSPWIDITQERVNQFAAATKDHQFIHTDPDRAARTPFGGTIAHGFLTLSLLSYMNEQTIPVPDNTEMVINYGSDRVRYLAPVRVGKRVRSHMTVLDVTEKKPGQYLLRCEVSIEIEGEEKPALVAELLWMIVTAA